MNWAQPSIQQSVCSQQSQSGRWYHWPQGGSCTRGGRLYGAWYYSICNGKKKRKQEDGLHTLWMSSKIISGKFDIPKFDNSDSGKDQRVVSISMVALLLTMTSYSISSSTIYVMDSDGGRTGQQSNTGRNGERSCCTVDGPAHWGVRVAVCPHSSCCCQWVSKMERHESHGHWQGRKRQQTIGRVTRCYDRPVGVIVDLSVQRFRGFKGTLWQKSYFQGLWKGSWSRESGIHSVVEWRLIVIQGDHARNQEMMMIWVRLAWGVNAGNS